MKIVLIKNKRPWEESTYDKLNFGGVSTQGDFSTIFQLICVILMVIELIR